MSPVPSGQAILAMASLSPIEQAGSKVLDLSVELGPHSALDGLIERILSHSGISNVNYKHVLTKLQSAVGTSLQAATCL